VPPAEVPGSHERDYSLEILDGLFRVSDSILTIVVITTSNRGRPEQCDFRIFRTVIISIPNCDAFRAGNEVRASK
jgi:hypothetical protein